MKIDRSISNVRSLLLGVGSGAAVVLLVGAIRPAPAPADVAHVLSDPPAGTIVRIVEGTTYTVPPGQLLSIKSFANVNGFSASFAPDVKLTIGGVGVLVAHLAESEALPIPFVAASGEVVSVEDFFADPATNVQAFGYVTRQ